MDNKQPRIVERAEAMEVASEKGRRVDVGILPAIKSTQGFYDERNTFWKPRTLGAPVLGTFVALALSMIALLETLSYIASLDGRGGGLSYAPNAESIPLPVKFWYTDVFALLIMLQELTVPSFLYLPTILAVFYSMAWSWVDLDTKRLEPWFQLSSADGASGKDSLLLQYPFDFLPLVPVTSFRRRHWNVFFSGTIMLIIFWVITPLQSAVFNTNTVMRTVTTDMVSTARLLSLEQQNRKLNSNFLNTAYGIAWLQQKPPAFTTKDFALLPFQPANANLPGSKSQTWSTTTSIYSTSLICTPSISKVPGLYDNGRGCSVILSLGSLSGAKYSMLYVGYYSDAVVSWDLKSTGNCTIEHADNFLAIWLTTDEEEDKITGHTAIFCRPKYHTQVATVTVNATNGDVVSQQFIEDKQTSSLDINEIFNTTLFEYALGAGVPPRQFQADLPDNFRLEGYPSVAKFNLAWPITNAVTFAVSLTENTIQELEDPVLLHHAFEAAHKLMFASAFSTLTEPSDISVQSIIPNGIIADQVGAITIQRPLAVVVEVACGIIAIMTFMLWYLSSRRPSLLSRDPSTISEVMPLVRSVVGGGNSSDWYSQKFSLSQSGIRICQRKPSKGAPANISSSTESVTEKEDSDSGEPVRPLALNSSVGLSFVAMLSAALSAVIFLERYSSKRNGLSIPSTNSTVTSIIENYIPTIFATLLEPFWIILNRMLCLLQPFDDLRRGYAGARSTIKAKYTSLPPPLTFWRAIRSGHCVLAVVCMITISTNILAVALAGLFEQRSIVVRIPKSSTQELIPMFNDQKLIRNISNAVYLDHFYAAQSNISFGTSLPPWLDAKRFYLPFDIPSVPVQSGTGQPLGLDGIVGSTTGIGASLSCNELSPNPLDNQSYSLAVNDTGTDVRLTTSHIQSNGTKFDCSVELQTGALTNGRSAWEIVRNGKGLTQGDEEFCTGLVIAGWVRVDTAAFTSEDVAPDGSASATFMACTPLLEVSSFDIMVNAEGRILDSKESENSKAGTGSSRIFVNTTYERTFMDEYITKEMFEKGSFQHEWHNDSFTRDWFNSLIKYKLKNNSFVDPAMPVPTYEQARPLLDETYQLIFALLIGLNSHVFKKAPQAFEKQLTMICIEQKLFFEPIMFKMTVILLGLQIIVAVLYYTRKPKLFLTKMPTSIAAVIELVAHSRALEDSVIRSEVAYLDRTATHNEDKRSKLDEERYGYGRFLGTDGKTHVGIEKMRYVIPLEVSNPEAKLNGRWLGRCKWRGRKQDAGEVTNWI